MNSSMRHLLTPTPKTHARNTGYIVRNQDFKQMVWDLTGNMEQVKDTVNPDARNQGQVINDSYRQVNEAVNSINELNNIDIKKRGQILTKILQQGMKLPTKKKDPITKHVPTAHGHMQSDAVT